MSEPNRPTVKEATMINAHTNPPQNGMKVWALGRGGCINGITWDKNSIEFYDAWYPYLKVPDDVKALRSARYAHAEPH